MFITRRKFLAMLGGAAAWPLATSVQLGISIALLMLAASPVALNARETPALTTGSRSEH
jgi:hypothetical protein